MGYSHAVLNPTFSEKCKLYILKPRFLVSHTQAGLLRGLVPRAHTSVAGCPPGQKRNSDVSPSTHTLLVPLGGPENDPLHVLGLIWPDQNPAATARLRPHASISNGTRPRRRVQKSPFEALGSLLAFFCSQNRIKSKKSWGRGADNISK